MGLSKWAAGFGLGLTLFHDWEEFVDQVLFWSAHSKPVAAMMAAPFIHDRLVAVEASADAVTLWSWLTSSKLGE